LLKICQSLGDVRAALFDLLQSLSAGLVLLFTEATVLLRQAQGIPRGGEIFAPFGMLLFVLAEPFLQVLLQLLHIPIAVPDDIGALLLVILFRLRIRFVKVRCRRCQGLTGLGPDLRHTGSVVLIRLLLRGKRVVDDLVPVGIMFLDQRQVIRLVVFIGFQDALELRRVGGFQGVRARGTGRPWCGLLTEP
jgi:hypothetical protein